MHSNEEKLMLLRVQLYGAMQRLKGAELDEYWALIEEVYAQRPLAAPGGRKE